MLKAAVAGVPLPAPSVYGSAAGRHKVETSQRDEEPVRKRIHHYQYTSALVGERLKLFFAQLLMLISSVSTEQSQMCVRNTVLVKQERGEPCWQDNLTHCLRQQVR